MGASLKIYTDGGARGNPGPAACAFVVIDSGNVIHKESKFLGRATNNEAEYEAVLLALLWLSRNNDNLKKESMTFVLDSELVARQLMGFYKVKSKNLEVLVKKVKLLEKGIEKRISYVSVRREENRLADGLVNEVLDENT